MGRKARTRNRVDRPRPIRSERREDRHAIEDIRVGELVPNLSGWCEDGATRHQEGVVPAGEVGSSGDRRSFLSTRPG